MPSKISLDEIKNRLFNIFGNLYEYKFDNFINTHSKIEVLCRKHGSSFQILKNLFKGHGCKKCGNENTADGQRKNIKDVIDDFKKSHGDKYDYSNFRHINNREKSEIICPHHGSFYQNYRTHSIGHGCPSCSNNKKFSKNDFIEASNKNHTIKYIYDFVEYKNMHTNVDIICPLHGLFKQIPLVHVGGGGCPRCSQSKGEKMIEMFLTRNNIYFNQQKKFINCINIKSLVFDFYLPDYNTCIEFNGIQHYKPIDIFGGIEEFNKNIKRDKIKVDYCNSNNIKLIIIKQDRKHIILKDVESQIENILNIINSN